MYSLDDIDMRLLAALQNDAQLTSDQLGEILGLSASQAGRRRHKLDTAGYITGYTARLGLSIQAFVQVHLNRHSAEHSKALAHLIARQLEIVSAWTLTGEADYLLRVYCATLDDLNRLIQETLLTHPTVARVHSQIVMNQTKDDAPLPMAAD
ncbi:Lrp/AsnC family transcriptional regulator [Rhodobacteraceae bacterium]|nr:Lrp/AsnC family transcriptional regulator [Paracoccaceae bacterium]